MKQYLDLLDKILREGIDKNDRTGVGTKSIFNVNLEFDMSEGFPLLTTKKMFLKGIIYELLWFIRGKSDVDWLQERGVHIWDEWEPKDESMYVPYPVMWRHYPGKDGSEVDQLRNAIDLIKNDPGSRRIIVDCWNAAESKNMTLTPCHCMFQYYVRGEYLDMKLIVRSNDVFLGQPFNIAQYSLLLMMTAQVTGLKAGMLYYSVGDCHLYKNHIEQAKLQLTRAPYKLPTMKLDPRITDIDGFDYCSFELSDYESWPSIKAPVAV